MSNLGQQFIEFSIQTNVLRFGEFKTKAGRLSPYFFNAGLFYSGSTLSRLADFYAKTLIKAAEEKNIKFDVIFGPAYKGITLAAAVAMRMSELGHDIPFAYNRKEKKDHGEGGSVVGAPLVGNVVIIDDVISAGTSIRESVEIIRQQGAHPACVLIALDRMEKSGTAENIGQFSATQQVQSEFGFPVIAIANLQDLLNYLNSVKNEDFFKYNEAVKAYREKYGA